MKMEILKVDTEQRRLGDFGERAAARMLKKAGYKILERNFTTDDAEIDVIAEKDGITAFVEVKTRCVSDGATGIEPRPASAVTPKKQRALIGAAKVYLAFNRGTRARLDVVEVYALRRGAGWRVHEIKHLVGAFDKNSASKRPWER